MEVPDVNRKRGNTTHRALRSAELGLLVIAVVVLLVAGDSDVDRSRSEPTSTRDALVRDASVDGDTRGAREMLEDLYRRAARSGS